MDNPTMFWPQGELDKMSVNADAPLISGDRQPEDYQPEGMSTIAKILFSLGAGLSAAGGRDPGINAFEALRQRRAESGQRQLNRKYEYAREGARYRSGQREKKSDNAREDQQAQADRDLRKTLAEEAQAAREAQAEQEHNFRMEEAKYRQKLATQAQEGQDNKLAQQAGSAIIGYANDPQFDKASPEALKQARADYELVLEMNGATDFEKEYWLRKFDARFQMPEPKQPPPGPLDNIVQPPPGMGALGVIPTLASIVGPNKINVPDIARPGAMTPFFELFKEALGAYDSFPGRKKTQGE